MKTTPALPYADALAHPRNYGSRRGTKVDRVVIHTTQGSFEGACSWFQNPIASASAHYIVAKDGRIARCVDEGSCAWHAGNSEFNRRSVGVELAGRCEDPAMFTSALLLSAARLVADICDRYGIPADRTHIIGHNEVPDPGDPAKRGGAHHHQDPGPFPWFQFISQVQSHLGGVA